MRVQFIVEAEVRDPEKLKKWVHQQYPGMLDEDNSMADYAVEALVRGSVPVRPEDLDIDIIDSHGSDR